MSNKSPTLSSHECLALAQKIAKDGSWKRFVHFDKQNRYFHLLQLDDITEVWLLCWTGDNDTGLHDHGEVRRVFVWPMALSWRVCYHLQAHKADYWKRAIIL